MISRGVAGPVSGGGDDRAADISAARRKSSRDIWSAGASGQAAPDGYTRGVSRAPLLLALLLARAPARAADIQVVPNLGAPIAPLPALTQLRLDLAALQAPAAASLSPAAFANLSVIARAEVPAPAAAAPLAAAPGPAAASLPAASAAASAVAVVPTDALRRVALAQQVLGQFEPGAFAKLPEGEQRRALDGLWDHWKAQGLVGGGAAPPSAPARGETALRTFDALVIEGVDDKALTSANKSIFLGVGVLGYPLEDALWLAHTRIRDAIDENALHYPAGQRWRTDDGTPEFLGTTAEGQELVDAWGRAVEYGRQLLKQAQAGAAALPASAEFSREAAAGLAAVAAELARKGDAEALRYLRDDDPTFLAFLLDARKPGYYLYNGDGSVVARVMATDAAKALGLRRVEHGDTGAVHRSLYFYRPRRVAERVAKVAHGTATSEVAPVRDRLASYLPRLEAAARALPPDAPGPPAYEFVDPRLLPASALDSEANALASYGDAAKTFSRYDLPVTAGTVRTLRAEGRRYGALDEGRWDALVSLYDACPALAAAAPETSLRVVSQPYQTRGRLIAPAKAPERGALINVFLLDRLASLRGDPAARAELLRFSAAALQASLAP